MLFCCAQVGCGRSVFDGVGSKQCNGLEIAALCVIAAPAFSPGCPRELSPPLATQERTDRGRASCGAVMAQLASREFTLALLLELALHLPRGGAAGWDARPFGECSVSVPAGI